MDIPELSAEDRRRGLEKALWLRKKRAEFRRQLKEGRIGLEEALGQIDSEVLGRMKVNSFLQALPGIGQVRSRRIMRKLGISVARRLQGLGPRQQELILDELKRESQ